MPIPCRHCWLHHCHHWLFLQWSGEWGRWSKILRQTEASIHWGGGERKHIISLDGCFNKNHLLHRKKGPAITVIALHGLKSGFNHMLSPKEAILVHFACTHTHLTSHRAETTLTRPSIGLFYICLTLLIQLASQPPKPNSHHTGTGNTHKGDGNHQLSQIRGIPEYKQAGCEGTASHSPFCALSVRDIPTGALW